MYPRSVAVATQDPLYRAATEAVALLDRSERGKLALSGPEAAECLDSLLSNDIASLRPGGGAFATLLTHKGRMLAEVRLLRSEQEIEIDTERVALQALFDALNQYRIGYRVELHKRTLQRGLLSLIGPGCDALLAQAPGAAENDHCAGELAGRAVRLIRTDVGVDVLCRERGHGGADAGAERGRRHADRRGDRRDHPHRARAPALRRRDRRDDDAPGGRHPRARGLLHEGLLRRPGDGRAALLEGQAEPPSARPAPGRAGGRRVPSCCSTAGPWARVGSYASSPRLGPIALAMLRREAEPGSALEVAGSAARATVVALPFDS